MNVNSKQRRVPNRGIEMGFDYWKECIREAFDNEGIVATNQQIDMVAEWVEGAHDNVSQATGQDCIPNPMSGELARVTRELAIEKNKVVCRECSGNGSTVSLGPHHSATSQCWKCSGEGRVTR